MKSISLKSIGQQIDQPWHPVRVAQVNQTDIKLVRLEGSFQWHAHSEEDEAFLVLEGTMKMHYQEENGTREHCLVEAGEMVLVPRGLSHCPQSVSDSCLVMLVEPATTINTGDGPANRRTVQVQNWNENG